MLPLLFIFPVVHYSAFNILEFIMYMFLPFLIALTTALSALLGKKRVSYFLWWVLLVVTILSFIHHSTDSLNLSF
ncbi:hypothetical protein BTJ39_11245 [Izhakiella australiensis]|uniref:Uncharacterized protein n=2 Tax=Izhakiella australiensis TaxID=1926881 RepID=A0A1S8YLU9_9GAMM|nr:hypothetical protein BTJ39_11245 [Izhakiella australiensis]